MGTMRQIVVRPLGLINRPNKYGQYPPGAMSTCANVALRKPGVVDAMPANTDICQNFTASGTALRIQFLGVATKFLVAKTDGVVSINGTTPTAVTVPTELPNSTFTFTAGKTHFALMRDRALLTGDQGVVAFDAPITTTAPRMAGIPALSFYGATINTTDGQSQPTATARRYRCVLRRTMSDGYEIVGEPSGPFQATNTSGATADWSPSIFWPADHGAITGDSVELYRTLDVPSGTDPGATYYLVGTRKLVNADFSGGTGVGAGSVSFYDRSLDDAITGARNPYLYTTDEGDDKANTPPPMANDAASFAGHLFYISPTIAPTYSFAVTGKYGLLSTTAERTYGIGRREVTGDTNTSTSITNVTPTAGLAIGQRITGTDIPADTRITNVVGSTLTISNAATGTTVGVTMQCTDVIEYGAGATDYIHMAAVAAGGNDTYFPEEHIQAAGKAPLLQWQRITPIESLNGSSVAAIDGPAFVVRSVRACQGSFTLRASNGANYAPRLPNTSDTAVSASTDPSKNRVHWSKEQKPEAVPLSNYFFVGSGELYRLIPTRDTTYAFCSDGLYRISGFGGEWRVDPVDSGCVLVDRDAVDVMDDVVWAVTNYGLVAIRGDDVKRVSLDRLYMGIEGYRVGDTHLGTYVVACDLFHREVWIVNVGSSHAEFIGPGNGSGSGGGVIYGLDSDAFSTWYDGTNGVAAISYAPSLDGNEQHGSIVFADDTVSPDLWRQVSEVIGGSRIANPEIRFQPITGDGDPFSLKEWGDVDFLFEGFASAATIVPSFSGTNYTARAVPTSSTEQRAVVSVPRNAPAIAPAIKPGFTFSAGGTTQNWSLRGVSVRWRPAGPEGGSR